ncbi:hypothetical protein ACMFMG_004465 [Clarireedia jacksonii]
MERRKTMSESGPSGSKNRVTFDEPDRPVTHGNISSPPAYGDEATSTLALPINRLSESSRSDASSGDHGIYATTTTTTHTVQTTTTFFRLPRRKKPAPLFDLGHSSQKSSHQDHSQSLSTNMLRGGSSHGPESAATRGLTSRSTENMSSHSIQSHAPPSSSHTSSSPNASAKSASAAGRPETPLLRQGSTASSSRSSPTRSRVTLRGRSSTFNSLRNMPTEDALQTPTLPSARTSTSTGRKSFGDLFGLSSRLRQNSDLPGQSGPGTPGSSTSKNNSMQLSREPIVLPERYEDDTPAKYLVRLEEAVSRGVVASVLSKGTDPFSQAVLRSYMRGFGFFGDPMDMAIRKLLMEVELPKETQQIDRCIQGFANRYHECNPGIYASPDQAYFIAFSLLILHTDVFNKNNKHKMQKADYLKNTRGEGIFDEILECFYDNISYTPFIHVEDDLDINGERIMPHKTKKKSSVFPRGPGDPAKRPSKEPVDPYTLIIDSKLDTLRPNLKDVMHLEDHYSYLGTATSLNLRDLNKTFFRTGVLQIVSARSRPDAFMSEKTVTNPEEAHPGIVDIKITKVGLLWRKDVKKKKTRSPWQEWGAILTGAQLYFFRNTAWIKSLMHQLDTHIKHGLDGSPVTFKPPLEQFKPDALMSTDDAVALVDSTYKKHKNAFVFVRHGGFEETFLADNEDEMNDWLAKLNYAAAFRTSGVRMRGVVGGNYDGQRSRGIRRLESHNESTKSFQTPTGEVTVVSGKIDNKMANEILAARREIMLQKISDAEEKLALAQKHLDDQLRNARHLQILAPIQPKTREQILLAAARMSAQLKWGRVEIWRLKCHKDILTMDLEDEKNGEAFIPKPEPGPSGDTPLSHRSALSRLQSKASSLTAQRTPKSPTLDSATRPSTATQPEKEHETEDVFQTSPNAKTASFHKAQASWELPPISFDALPPRKTSVSGGAPTSPMLEPRTSRSSLKPSIPDPQASSDPNLDAAEQSVLAQTGLIDSDVATGDRSEAAMDTEENRDINDKDKGKIRRSLHRTLREAHVPTHHRSRKGKDSASSAAMSDEGNVADETLTRGSGSFVVHGKKASVITFGTEFQSMSHEERLRLRKQPQKDNSDLPSPASIDDDFHSIITEPAESRARHDSTGTTSTATARSFRDLHRRYSAQGHNKPNLAVNVDDDSEAALSISEGRRTPLPPVEDENEDENSSRQMRFYTPEPEPSPLADEHMGNVSQGSLGLTIDVPEQGHRVAESERLPSPTIQAVGA